MVTKSGPKKLLKPDPRLSTDIETAFFSGAIAGIKAESGPKAAIPNEKMANATINKKKLPGKKYTTIAINTHDNADNVPEK
jgi:hypothetical protein